MEANQILDDSLQDAINAAIAVMKDNDDIKVEELMTGFGSPELGGEKLIQIQCFHWNDVCL
jgi:DNA-binding protein YbaB